MRFAYLAAFLCISACASTNGLPLAMTTIPKVDLSAPEVTIFNDIGGNPYEYEILRQRLAEAGTRVRLGECNSACTILMTLERACLIPGTRFGFHRSNFGGLHNGVNARYYRAGVLEAFQSDWGNSPRITRRTAEELVVLDPQLKLCASRRRTSG